MKDSKDKQAKEPKNPNPEKKEEEEDHPYKSVDIKFIQKHKKYVNDKIEEYASEYLHLIRPTNDKSVTVDAQAKDQIMYIFYRLLEVVSKMKEDVPDDSSEISKWIEKSLDTSTSNYKVYRFLCGVAKDLKYNLVGSKIEEEVLMIISEFVDDEDVMQHTVELFILFIKKFSEALANLNWESTKKTNSKLVNSLLRNMNNNNTNPDIFGEIFEFANHCKS